MLSRFSKLPGVSALFHANSGVNYSQQSIDAAVSEIKVLGKYMANTDDTLQAITKILSIMKKFSESIHVQRVSCHALSNLAMQVAVARWIVQRNGFQLIRKALLKFESDHKLCWLGSSAIWNLARPPANRSVIGKDGVDLMMRMLHLHHDKEKVTNTTIGALSNLSLCDSLKAIIAEPQNVDLIVSVLSEYASRQSLAVLTSGAGLLANLAVSDEFGSVLVQRGSIQILLKLLAWNSGQMDDTLHRNTCAALNNMVTAPHFLDAFLECRGVESVFDFLETNTNPVFNSLLENCLVNIEVDVNEPTTSFHLCAMHGRLDILKKLVAQFPLTDLNETDSKKMSMLDYAIMSADANLVEFLSRCGATRYQANLLMDSRNQSNDAEKQREEEERRMTLESALKNGIEILRESHHVHGSAIAETLPDFPTELCRFMATYQSNVDLLQAVNKYE